MVEGTGGGEEWWAVAHGDNQEPESARDGNRQWQEGCGDRGLILAKWNRISLFVISLLNFSRLLF